MKRLGEVGLMATLLSACVGGTAGGQAAPPVSPNLYEVPAGALTTRQAAPDTGSIMVQGTGSVSIRPDRSRVSFAVETRAASAAGAAGDNAALMQAVLGAVRGGELEGLELETFGYSLRPEYSTDQSQRTREIVAYTAMNNVRATIHGSEAVGRVIDLAIGGGANRVSSIDFFASDTREARADALQEAVRNAREEARLIAEALGFRLGPPLEVNGGAQAPSPVGMERTMRSMQAAPTPIEAGDQTVTANVSIRFALGPEMGG